MNNTDNNKNFGFVKVASGTPLIKVADVTFNYEQICEVINKASKDKASLLVLPELVVTGYTCGDLFLQDILLENALKSVIKIKDYIKGLDMVVIVGLPFSYNSKLYNVAAVLHEGKILGIVPKTHIPNYSEFYELRHFNKGPKKPILIDVFGEEVYFGTNIIFESKDIKGYKIAVELCEDLWVPLPPSTMHAIKGASIIANLSASDEITGKDKYRMDLIKNQSARLLCGYIYSDAGEGESTTDLVFSSHNVIAENGDILTEATKYKNELVFADIDLERIENERRRINTFVDDSLEDNYITVKFSNTTKRDIYKDFTRKYYHAPFVPASLEDRSKRCDEIFMIQAMGLKKRLVHTGAKAAIVGISGGLDSTLALLVTVKAFELLGLDLKGIKAVTMPGFGTSDRTYNNAVLMIKLLNVDFLEINIKKAVLSHFEDIGHDSNVHDVVYENSQARQRTMLLMDLANKYNGFVIGTGDMSELALGWATYNGDHMSMYGVNASIPKTLVRHLVEYYADTCKDKELSSILKDVSDTPVSPELLPLDKDGLIAQKTEDFVGPYELHDFFIYYVLRYGYTPEKVFFLTKNAFKGMYEEGEIKKWLDVFYRRFFSQQYKRSCLPDGPKVGSIAVSPRGDLRMPSDASFELWIDK